MSNLQRPKNDWAKAIYILYDSFMAGVSMAKVLTKYEPCFYKFQTRLLEIERCHPKLKISRVSIPYKSRMDGKNRHYTQYTQLSPKPYVLNLYNLINEKGLVDSVTENSAKTA